LDAQYAGGVFMNGLPDAAFLGGLQLILYGCCWGLAVLLLAEQRRASVHWGMYSVLAGVSVWLIALSRARGEAACAVTALTLSLVGYAAAVRGVDLFLHDRPRIDRLTWGVTGLACAAILWLGTSAELTRAHLAVFGLARVLLLSGSALLFARELWRQFGALGALVAVVPSLLFGLASVPVLYRLAVTPDAMLRIQSSSTQSVDKVALALITAALFNFSFLYMLVGRLFKRLRHQAQHDALTGLLNRGAMDHALRHQWQQHRRLGHGLALAVLDIDHFKRINDTHGHPVGDQVLVAVARALATESRAADIVARMGGEEFLVLMPGADAPGARRAVERLRKVVEALRIPVPGGEIQLTLSAGLALVTPDDVDAAAVMRRADVGVYTAKREGRNRVVLEGCAAFA
jgi:diguanylate cyclase (GGDEF)-like protein